MYGTGKMQDMESEYYDVYIDKRKTYHAVHEEFWQFVVQRYGGQEIVRKWVPLNSYNQG